MSIAKAQAEALAEGFLDDIGTTDKGELRPKETYAEAIVLAGELIEAAQNNLISGNNISSGKGSASLVAGDPENAGGVMRVTIFMNFYLRFVNKGVKGTRSGSSNAGYSFKNEIVSRKMYDAIHAWIQRGKISTSNVRKYKNHGLHEKKSRRLAALADADMAFAVARSIKQKGLKATGFLDKAVAATQQKVSDRLGAALKIDIINALNNI